MPLVDINNPEVLKFLTENYERTAQLRMRWNTLHAKKLNKAATLNREEKGYRDTDAVVATIETGILCLSRDHESGARNRRLKPVPDALHIQRVAHMRTGHSIVDINLGDPKMDPRLSRPDTDLTPDPIMRPINPLQKEILYKDQPYFGRKMYLANRHKSAVPEDRYYFAETSGWDYGWRLKDSYFNNNIPEHGRVWCLTHAVSHSGPQPDPVHYRDAAHATPCSTL